MFQAYKYHTKIMLTISTDRALIGADNNNIWTMSLTLECIKFSPLNKRISWLQRVARMSNCAQFQRNHLLAPIIIIIILILLLGKLSVAI